MEEKLREAACFGDIDGVKVKLNPEKINLNGPFSDFTMSDINFN